MFKKISLFKNVLKVIILGLILFNMLKSCSMAYNIEDIYEYTQQLNSIGKFTSAYRIISQKYNQLKNIEQLQNCKSIVVQRDYYSDQTDILYWNQPYHITFDSAQNLRGLPEGNFVRIKSDLSIQIGTFTIGFRNDPVWRLWTT